ncbi:metal ABC transporter permease [Enterovirga rhinocerotis]|uniref:Manganese transport system permease protein/manganese/iron transport system permease protein n=1 Tax=Enterovirga rhinocerotis TaxID=1339210 RepID=A0A4R7C580_9HYPH|nr:metal ABC transporter permease [Enterovirga rhinocerotis]TDR93032.1 manganese transport system permease protein/manganese/iron transport system permease protein [Enterovirga rhinocerotis]
MGPLELLIEPLRHGFMVQAMLVGAFVCAVCAALSCFVVLKGWSLVGDALAHAVLPGIVLAALAGLPMALGAIASGILCVQAAGFVSATSRVKPDAVLGILFTGFLALGIVLVTAFPGDVDFTHILFGNLLGITTADLVQTLVLGTLALGVVLVMRRDFVLFCFDPVQARVNGLSPRWLEQLLLLLVAATAVASLQAVGLALVLAMLITPGCVGLLLARRFDAVLAVAMGSAVLSAVVGTLASFHLDGATGPCIVLAQAIQFVAAFLFAPRRGILRRKTVAA